MATIAMIHVVGGNVGPCGELVWNDEFVVFGIVLRVGMSGPLGKAGSGPSGGAWKREISTGALEKW